MNGEWQARYDAAIRVTQAASRIALRYFCESSLTTEWKANCSPVTIANREAKRVLREELLGRFPMDGFLGEESGVISGSSGYRWIVDPIDGTRSFIRGIPLWATLVGLEHKDELIAGVVSEPVFEHVYHALQGDGAHKNGHRISVS